MQKLNMDDSEESSISNEEEVQEKHGKSEKFARNTPSAKSEKSKKILVPLPGVDMTFDADDHILTYARKVVDRDPQYFEEYGAVRGSRENSESI